MSGEHAHEEAAARPAAPVAAAAAPAAAAPTAPGLVLGLQRSAGNKAVARVLARQHAPGTPRDPTAADFGVTGGEPKARPGPVQASLDGGKVKLATQGVEADATVKLKDPKANPIGKPVAVGFHQVITQTDRIGKYRRKGTTQDTLEHHATIPGKALDKFPSAPGGGPFYADAYTDEQGNEIGRGQKLVSDADPAASVHFEDKPSTQFAREQGDSELYATAGRDAFKLSVAFRKPDGKPEHLKVGHWNVDWTAAIDPGTGKGTGKEIEAGSDPAADVPPDAAWKTSDKLSWNAIKDPATAAKASTLELIQGVSMAQKTGDTVAFGVMKTALVSRKPAISLGLAAIAVTKGSLWYDSLTIRVKGSAERILSENFSAGESKVLQVPLFDVADIDAIAARRPAFIEVTVAEERTDSGKVPSLRKLDPGLGRDAPPAIPAETPGASSGPARLIWEFPFAAHARASYMAAGGAMYEIGASLT